MDAGIKETKEQALKEMELFKTVFDGVRLLNMHAFDLSFELALTGYCKLNDGVPIPLQNRSRSLISGRKSIRVTTTAVLCCRL